MGNVTRRELIDQYKIIHREKLNYGRSSEDMISVVLLLFKSLKGKLFLDYGCGKSNLANQVSEVHGTTVCKYDPSIPEHSTRPKGQFDLVTCTDVMEHIPEEDITSVLMDIKNCSQNVYFVISTRLAKAVLPDGRNAHLTVKPGLGGSIK